MFAPIVNFLTNEKFIKTIIILILLVVVYFSLKKILNKLLHYQTKKLKIDIKKFNTLNSLTKVLLRNLVIWGKNIRRPNTTQTQIIT